MSADRLPFRPGDVLATSFTGTLSERYGSPVERLPSPERLLDWLVLRGLDVNSCSDDELLRARELRESIHVLATATALKQALPPAPRDVVNACSAGGRSAAQLTPEGRLEWDLGARPCVADALAVIATDAIELLAGGRGAHLSLCSSPTCRAVFLDTSQSHTRRWCDMNTCGNRNKKARLQARRRAKS